MRCRREEKIGSKNNSNNNNNINYERIHIAKTSVKIRHVKDRTEIVKDGKRKKRSMKAHREKKNKKPNEQHGTRKKSSTQQSVE